MPSSRFSKKRKLSRWFTGNHLTNLIEFAEIQIGFLPLGAPIDTSLFQHPGF